MELFIYDTKRIQSIVKTYFLVFFLKDLWLLDLNVEILLDENDFWDFYDKADRDVIGGV